MIEPIDHWTCNFYTKLSSLYNSEKLTLSLTSLHPASVRFGRQAAHRPAGRQHQSARQLWPVSGGELRQCQRQRRQQRRCYRCGSGTRQILPRLYAANCAGGRPAPFAAAARSHPVAQRVQQRLWRCEWHMRSSVVAVMVRWGSRSPTGGWITIFNSFVIFTTRKCNHSKPHAREIYLINARTYNTHTAHNHRGQIAVGSVVCAALNVRRLTLSAEFRVCTIVGVQCVYIGLCTPLWYHSIKCASSQYCVFVHTCWEGHQRLAHVFLCIK